MTFTPVEINADVFQLRHERVATRWFAVAVIFVGLTAFAMFANNLDGSSRGASAGECLTVATGKFCYDDAFAIVNNADAHSDSPFWPLFVHDFWGQRIGQSVGVDGFRS